MSEHRAHMAHSAHNNLESIMMPSGKLRLVEIMFADPVEVASGFFERLRGLLGRSDMPSGSAMVIERCGSVHTVGMRFPLDLIFLDKEWRVVSVKRGVRPGCPMVSGGIRARRVVESRLGALDLNGMEIGVQLEFVNSEH